MEILTFVFIAVCTALLHCLPFGSLITFACHLHLQCMQS